MLPSEAATPIACSKPMATREGSTSFRVNIQRKPPVSGPNPTDRRRPAKTRHDQPASDAAEAAEAADVASKVSHDGPDALRPRERRGADPTGAPRSARRAGVPAEWIRGTRGVEGGDRLRGLRA